MSGSIPSPEQLWQWALEDAGDAGDVHLVEVSSFESPNSRGRFMPPGERVVPVGPEDLAKANALASSARVLLPVSRLGEDPAALLALMRHHLEYARVLRAERATYRLSLSVAAALYPLYQYAGPGSAVVYNAIPMMRSANAAAGRLVARKLGPQFSRLDDSDLGALFRTDRPPVPLQALSRHTTVFAAIWPEALADELQTEGETVEAVLQAADVHAPSWWGTLRAEETFRAVAFGAASFRPTGTEREIFHDEPSVAWRTGAALIDRACALGLGLLTLRPALDPVK